MRYWLAFGIIMTMITTAFAEPRMARMQCVPYDVLIQQMTDKYGESQRAALIGADNRLVELWATDGGSWTFIVRMDEATGCILAAGQSWSGLLEPSPVLKGEES